MSRHIRLYEKRREEKGHLNNAVRRVGRATKGLGKSREKWLARFCLGTEKERERERRSEE